MGDYSVETQKQRDDGMSEESFAYLARENASLGRQRIGLQALYLYCVRSTLSPKRGESLRPAPTAQPRSAFKPVVADGLVSN